VTLTGEATVNEQSGWAVDAVEILSGNRVRVLFSTHGDRQEFVTRRFGIGRRGKRSAALARFCFKSGLTGDVMDAYRHICFLPATYTGPLLFPPVVEERPTLSLVS
jgi:hypothetical protein